MSLSRRQWLILSGVGLVTPLPTDAKNQSTWAYPGGLVDLRWRKRSNRLPTVRFGLQEALVIDHGAEWRALIGLALNTVPGDYIAYVKPGSTEEPAFTQNFAVLQKRYPMLKVDSLNRFKGLDPDDVSVLDFANSVPPSLPWQAPVDAEWVDDFGQVMVAASGSPTIEHKNYLTFTKAADTSQTSVVVKAPQSGIVSRITNLNASNTAASKSDDSSLNSNQDQNDEPRTICIDHGRGLFSVFHGLEDITVDIGNGVVAGAVIGKTSSINSTPDVGASSNIQQRIEARIGSQTRQSKASGRQLRWQCVLNGAYINPLIMTQLK